MFKNSLSFQLRGSRPGQGPAHAPVPDLRQGEPQRGQRLSPPGRELRQPGQVHELPHHPTSQNRRRRITGKREATTTDHDPDRVPEQPHVRVPARLQQEDHQDQQPVEQQQPQQQQQQPTKLQQRLRHICQQPDHSSEAAEPHQEEAEKLEHEAQARRGQCMQGAIRTKSDCESLLQ